MERIPEPTLLALLGGQRLDGLQVEVVVEVKVVEVLAVDEQVEHIVALATDLWQGHSGEDVIKMEVCEIKWGRNRQGSGHTQWLL